MGWPKGCKTYGHRVGVVPNLRVASQGYSLGNAGAKGRPTVFNVSNSRSYSTGGTKNVANAMDSLALHCSVRPDRVVDRKLYKMLCSEKFIIMAYNQSIVKERVDNGFYQGLAQQLRSETFQFMEGGTRRTRGLQEAIRIILNAIYEPTFLESSHGFRPNRGCHTALESIKLHFQGAS